jgi:hypothetical protein
MGFFWCFNRKAIKKRRREEKGKRRKKEEKEEKEGGERRRKEGKEVHFIIPNSKLPAMSYREGRSASDSHRDDTDDEDDN